MIDAGFVKSAEKPVFESLVDVDLFDADNVANTALVEVSIESKRHSKKW